MLVAFTNIIHYLQKLSGFRLCHTPHCAWFNKPTWLVYPKLRLKSIRTGAFSCIELLRNRHGTKRLMQQRQKCSAPGDKNP